MVQLGLVPIRHESFQDGGDPCPVVLVHPFQEGRQAGDLARRISLKQVVDLVRPGHGLAGSIHLPTPYLGQALRLVEARFLRSQGAARVQDTDHIKQRPGQQGDEQGTQSGPEAKAKIALLVQVDQFRHTLQHMHGQLVIGYDTQLAQQRHGLGADTQQAGETSIAPGSQSQIGQPREAIAPHALLLSQPVGHGIGQGAHDVILVPRQNDHAIAVGDEGVGLVDPERQEGQVHFCGDDPNYPAVDDYRRGEEQTGEIGLAPHRELLAGIAAERIAEVVPVGVVGADETFRLGGIAGRDAVAVAAHHPEHTDHAQILDRMGQVSS